MKKRNLGSRIKLLYFIGFMGIILVSVLGFAMISNRMYTRQTVQFCENAVQLNLNLLEKSLLQIQEGQRMLAEDPQMQDIIMYRNKNEEVDYAVELYHQRDMADKFSILFRNMEIDNAYIVDAEGECLYFYKAPVRSAEMMEQQWLLDIIDNADLSTSYISKVHDKSYLFNRSEEECVSMVMPLTLGVEGKVFSPCAYLVCDLQLRKLLANNTTDIQYAVVYSDNEWYSSKELADSEEIKAWIKEEEDSRKEIRVKTLKQPEGNDLLVVAMKTKVFGMQLLGVKELTEAGIITRGLIVLCAGIMCIAMLFTFLVSKITVRSITAPMQGLMENCNEVAAGNYNLQFETQQIEEFAVLSDTVQNMIHEVMTLNQKMIEEEKKFSAEKLRALQHQINPHFMNNVLQSIKGMALSGENEKISAISTYLGKIMAYSVYRPYEDVTLGEALEHVKNYLEVQKIRFDNRILYSIDCDREYANVRLPKLTIQPLVENAVEHGQKVREKEFINISVEEEKDMVCVMISDNGVGISEEKIKELNQKLASGEAYQQDKSIGILNVNERIQKKYGTAYGVEIISREGSGTTVILKISREDKRGTADEGITGG